MRKLLFSAVLMLATCGLSNAQITSIQIDSTLYPTPTVAQCYVSYTGLLSSAFVDIWYGQTSLDSVSQSSFVASGNGNVMITLSGLLPGGISYGRRPKVIFPFVFDGPLDTFTTPVCLPIPSVSISG